MIVTVTLLSGPRREVIWVAKRVQSSTSRSRGRPVIVSSRDDLPELWSPTATSLIDVSEEHHLVTQMTLNTYLGERNMLVDALLPKFVNLLEQERAS